MTCDFDKTVDGSAATVSSALPGDTHLRWLTLAWNHKIQGDLPFLDAAGTYTQEHTCVYTPPPNRNTYNKMVGFFFS